MRRIQKNVPLKVVVKTGTPALRRPTRLSESSVQVLGSCPFLEIKSGCFSEPAAVPCVRSPPAARSWCFFFFFGSMSVSGSFRGM